ncbi:MAG: hypothetical protein AAGA25_17175, partial [Planctomycetota bacterium]
VVTFAGTDDPLGGIDFPEIVGDILISLRGVMIGDLGWQGQRTCTGDLSGAARNQTDENKSGQT